MATSAPSPRIARGSVDSALTLKKQIASSDDSRPAMSSPLAGDGARTEAAPRVEALDARWQSLIDAATD